MCDVVSLEFYSNQILYIYIYIYVGITVGEARRIHK